MLVSIIVTTKNEEAHLADLLDSIKKQTYKQIEIIVVDNNSTDQTISIAKHFTHNVFQQGPERSAQRNFGAKKAKGDILIFLDADMQLTPHVISSCVSVLQESTYVGVVIPEKSIGTGFWSECKRMEREYYWGVDWIESARCVTRISFEKVGGYDESMSGPEDFDMPQRIKHIFGNKSITRIPDFIIHNEGRLQYWELMKRKFYYGRSMKRYIAKKEHASEAVKQGNIIERYLLFINNPEKIISQPIVFLGMLVLKTSELTALGLGTLVGLKGAK